MRQHSFPTNPSGQIFLKTSRLLARNLLLSLTMFNIIRMNQSQTGGKGMKSKMLIATLLGCLVWQQGALSQTDTIATNPAVTDQVAPANQPAITTDTNQSIGTSTANPPAAPAVTANESPNVTTNATADTSAAAPPAAPVVSAPESPSTTASSVTTSTVTTTNATADTSAAAPPAAPVVSAPESPSTTASSVTTSTVTTTNPTADTSAATPPAAPAVSAPESPSTTASSVTTSTVTTTNATTDTSAATPPAAPAVSAPAPESSSVTTTNETASTANSQPSAPPSIPLIQFQDVPITTAIENLARQAGINYLLDPKIGYGQPDQNGQIKPEPTLSIRWENVTAGQALMALLDNYGLQLNEDRKTQIARITAKDPTAPPPLSTRVIQI